MFDIGFWEFALIAIVALVVVGPDRLPAMTRTAGQLIGRAKRTMRELKYDLEREADFEEIKNLQKDFTGKSLKDFTKTLDEPVDIEDEESAFPKSLDEPIDIEDEERIEQKSGV